MASLGSLMFLSQMMQQPLLCKENFITERARERLTFVYSFLMFLEIWFSWVRFSTDITLHPCWLILVNFQVFLVFDKANSLCIADKTFKRFSHVIAFHMVHKRFLVLEIFPAGTAQVLPLTVLMHHAHMVAQITLQGEGHAAQVALFAAVVQPAD